DTADLRHATAGSTRCEITRSASIHTHADGVVRRDRPRALGHRHLRCDGVRGHATYTGDRHSNGARCTCSRCTEDGGWIRNVPGFDRCSCGTDRRLRPDTIDGQSLIRRVADRSCDVWIGYDGPTDRGAASVLHPGAPRNEGGSTGGAEIRVVPQKGTKGT